MNSKFSFSMLVLLTAMILAAGSASAQTQLLVVDQAVPMAATLDNPCTAAIEAIAFTGTTNLHQEVWLMPGGTTRLVVAETTTLQGSDTALPLGTPGPTYSVAASQTVDAEFNPGAATLYNYKKVVSSDATASDNFYTVLVVDFDPNSLRLNLGLESSCGDGAPTP